jgi:DNA polymerase I
MVASVEQFLIDATFIAEKTRKTFLGAPLLTVGGQDCTFVFGFLRDFLRLRHTFRINAGLVLVGRESYSASSRDRIHGVIAIFKELGIPHIHDPLNSTPNLACSICSHFSHIITADEKFLQLTSESLIIMLPRKGKEREWDWMSSKIVKDMIGIAPRHVPTYMALTDSPNTASLTNRQAVRLIESFGDLDGIYGNLRQIVPVHTRIRLAKSEAQIRSIYAGKTGRHVEGLALKSFSKYSLNKLDTATNRRRLMKYGFRSLSILLPTPAQLQRDLPDNVCSPISYHAVVDRKALKQLKSSVCASKLCAVDVESDGKDPRTANLLGIAFSVKTGEAHFVPLAAVHLKGLTRRYALRIIKQILNSGVAFVGHNIKYDSLLLRRAGARIRNVHFDTMLAAFECHGDWPFFNLAYVCKRILGKEIKSYSDTVSDDSTFLDLPLIEMVNHACQDADFALRLYPALSDQLEERCIARQFREHTMKHLERLSNLEFDGMAIDLERVGRIRKRISRRAEHLRLSICTTVGRVVDLASQEDLAAVLRETAQLQGYVGPRRVTVSTLEHLAVSEPLARQMLNFRRLRNRGGRLEAISASVRNGRIYPLFNQNLI